MITLIMSILITSMVLIAREIVLNHNHATECSWLAISLALITNGIVGRPYFGFSLSKGSSAPRIIELLRVIFW